MPFRLINRAANKLRTSWFRSSHSRAGAALRDTAPLLAGTAPFTLLSMVHKRDVLAYLAAAKSFARWTQPRGVVLVCDPTLSADDRALIREHIPCIELRDAEEFVDPRIPRGGTWERLHAIVQRASDEFVIQLDADTLTLACPSEVMAAVAAPHGFVIGEAAKQSILTVEEITAEMARFDKPGAHIQVITEARMASVGLPTGSRYVRGCSGFTGFAPEAALHERFFDFSARMSRLLGQDWQRWGTEQVTSNFLVANQPGTKLLPFPKYATPAKRSGDSVFLHYIGSERFNRADYARDTKSVIASLPRKN